MTKAASSFHKNKTFIREGACSNGWSNLEGFCAIRLFHEREREREREREHKHQAVMIDPHT